MSFEPSESTVVEDEVSSPEIVQSAAMLSLRMVLIQDQLHAAAAKVNLLVDMGLTRTTGYTDALALYQTRLADFNEMRAQLGL